MYQQRYFLFSSLLQCLSLTRIAQEEWVWELRDTCFNIIFLTLHHFQ